MNMSETDIAVIGMAGRFPGAPNLERFWANLRDGVEGIRFFTDEELLAAGVSAEQLRHPNYVKAKGVLDDVALFDAAFFGFSPREAEILDVQHRLFLECAWQALEQAGYGTTAVEFPIGLYAGVGLSSYLLNNIYPHLQGGQTADLYQIMLGNDKDYLPTRVAYKLNLQGPALAVQTACSTSLVAIHLACQSLLSGECDMALAGGVTVSLPQGTGYLYQEGMILSPDGHCRAFDARAGGTVSGNGVGIVVLKRLAEAVADGDFVWAVVKGTAVNNDGAHKIGYTAPSQQGQTAVIREALALARLKPEDISYVEAHGTGTVLGDPLEMAALMEVYSEQGRSRHSAQKWCAIGSVKTNVGHLDTAAGVAGFIKTVLALHYRQLPPSLHFEEPNPEIDFANSPFYVNTELRDWRGNGRPLCAGVSSFGIGGTNAHVVLAEFDAKVQRRKGEEESERGREALLILSARTEKAVATAVANLADHLQAHPELDLGDVAFTLANGRKAFSYRRFVVAQAVDEAVKELRGNGRSATVPASPSPVAFLFPGQGAQYAGMGDGLYQTYPVFRKAMDRCDEISRPFIGNSISSLQSPVSQTQYAQPALFALGYSLAQLWLSWGIRPSIMLGHSLGEFVAACLAGVFSLEDGLWLVAKRGQLMQSMPEGKMVSVNLSVAAVRPLLTSQLDLAVINGAEQCVIAGSNEAIAELQQALAADDILHTELHTSHAYHSAMMEPIVEDFVTAVRQISLHAPQIPYSSNVTGRMITADQATNPTYWGQHLRQTVQFADGLQTLLAQSPLILLEMGPGRTLTTLARRHSAQQADHALITTMRSGNEMKADTAVLLEALGQVWQQGSPVDWQAFYGDNQRRRVPLPTYPFERQNYWIEPGQVTASFAPTAVKFYLPSWERSLWPDTDWANLPTPCLIFADGLGLGAALTERLQTAVQQPTIIQPGDEFAQLSSHHFVLNPARAGDYERLLGMIGQRPSTIFHCWTMTEETAVTADSVSAMQQVGFFSLLHLVQALGEGAQTDLVIVSNHLHEVTGSDFVHPGKATLLGLVRVIPQEYAHMTCRIFDVERPSDQVVERLLADVVHTDDPHVAYRSRHRWLPNYVPIQPKSTTPSLRPKGVYLITGGLGGVGFRLAEYLAEAMPGVQLALLNRSGDKVQKARQLELLGAEVMVITADVANPAQLQTALDQICQQWGAINGVIHAAGVAGGGLIQVKEVKDVLAEFAAPVYGTMHLANLLRDDVLDFFVLCSSHTSATGGVGQAAYSAANAFQDAFAQSAVGITAVNWDRWQNVGMATAIEQLLQDLGQNTLTPGLTPALGKAVLGQLLTMDTPQVIVSTAHFPTLLAQTQRYQLGELAARPRAQYERPNLTQTYTPPRNETESQIAAIWQAVLGLQSVGVLDDFFELGGDSLIALQLVSQLQKSLHVEIKIHTIYDQPTVAGLADYATTLRWLAEGQAKPTDEMEMEEGVL